MRNLEMPSSLPARHQTRLQLVHWPTAWGHIVFPIEACWTCTALSDTIRFSE